MKRKIELLAPGGDVDSIKAAIAAGADAVYCGLGHFNARNRATNIDFDDLSGILNLAHRNDCKVFLTINIIIVESEIRSIVNLLNKLINTTIDGVIVQDLGLFHLLSNYFKGLEIHASTQLTTHNEGQIKFLGALAATRVNLSRELSIDEVRGLTLVGHENNISTEVFVHGSNCISFSGICYMSSVLEGKSGNRGRCSQPCRDRYSTTPEGRNFPLNLKDNSAYSDLMEIYDAGVDSIKIEGRMKKFHYVYTVVDAWRSNLDSLYCAGRPNADDSAIHKVFNRGFSNSFLNGNINKDMYIDNPRDNSASHLSAAYDRSTDESMQQCQKELHDAKAEIETKVKDKIKKYSIATTPLTISVSGSAGSPLKLFIETPDDSFFVFSGADLALAGTSALSPRGPDRRGCPGAMSGRDGLAPKINKSTAKGLDRESLLKSFKSLNDRERHIERLESGGLQAGLFIPFKELTSIKKRILCALNGSIWNVDPISIPRLEAKNKGENRSDLSVLISSKDDLYLCDETSARMFFQLPSCFNNDCSDLIDLFRENRNLIPWFPSVLIGKDYAAAVDILSQLQPKLIVTNNTGIAYEAYVQGIDWIAGPYLNIVNSFSLLALKSNFNCYGSFISNEISKYQMKRIVAPPDFKLYYGIYHPIPLLTSRQCLFHQVVGCRKEIIDEECIHECSKSASITNLKNVSLYIEKNKGDYNCLYNNNNFLNVDIVTDLPEVFSSFFIDLRDVKTQTEIEIDKAGIIKIFENLLNGDPESKKELKKMIHPSTDAQYEKGI